MYDVVIVGAGPAGTACALALSQQPALRVALLDKAPAFPRDKICGDAIPGAASRELTRLAQQLGIDLGLPAPREHIRHARFFGNQPRALHFTWFVPAINATRLDFDAWLWEAVQQHTNTEILCDAHVSDISVEADGILLQAGQQSLRTRLVIGCDGAHSAVSRALTSTRPDRRHQLAAVRAYYTGVTGTEAATNDIYFMRRWQPGYLWIFPVGEGRYNVGFGMASDEVARRHINLKTALQEALAEHPALRERFAQAQQVGKTVGFTLPIGSRDVSCVGERFMLCGDAAALIDPIGGHGIDTAIISGVLAAEVALDGFRQNRLDADFLTRYSQQIDQRLRPKLRRNGHIMRLGGKAPWLMDVAVQLARVPCAEALGATPNSSLMQLPPLRVSFSYLAALLATLEIGQLADDPPIDNRSAFIDRRAIIEVYSVSVVVEQGASGGQRRRHSRSRGRCDSSRPQRH